MGQKISIRRPTQTARDKFTGKRATSFIKRGSHQRFSSRSLPSPFVSNLPAAAESKYDSCCNTIPKANSLPPLPPLRPEVAPVSRNGQSELSPELPKLIIDANDDVNDGTRVVLLNTGTSTTHLEGEPVLDADVSVTAVCNEASLTDKTYDDCPSLYGPGLASSPPFNGYETMTQFYTGMRSCGRPRHDTYCDQSVYGNDGYLRDAKLTFKQHINCHREACIFSEVAAMVESRLAQIEAMRFSVTVVATLSCIKAHHVETCLCRNPSFPTAAVHCQQDQTTSNDVSRAHTNINRSDETHLQHQHEVYQNVPPYGGSSRRPHVRLPLDSCSVYKWKFLSVTTFRAGGADGDTDAIPSIAVVCSKEQEDFPPLADGCSILHGSVIHLLPHNQTFSEPIFVSIEIPSTVPTSRLSSLSIYYSPTSLGEPPTWRRFRAKLQTVDGVLRFEEEQETTSGDLQPQARNAALVSTERREVTLSLRHFCIFAIVVDGRQEIVQKASVIGFIKIPSSGSSYPFVNILLLLGCNQTAMAENESLALHQGYTKVQNQTLHIYESGGNIQVSVDFVDWIDKAIICCRHPVVHRSVEVWNESTKTYLRIKPPEAWVEQNGFNSNFFATLIVRQDGKEPVTVTIEEDLHKLVPPNSESLQSARLPFCICQNCLQPHPSSSYHPKAEPVAEAAVGRMTSQNQPERKQEAAAADADASSTNDRNTEITSFEINLRSTHSSLENEQAQGAAHSPNNLQEFDSSSSSYKKAIHDPTRHESRQPEQNRKQLNDGVHQHQVMQKDVRRVDDEELSHFSIQETTPVAWDGLQRRAEQIGQFNRGS